MTGKAMYARLLIINHASVVTCFVVDVLFVANSTFIKKKDTLPNFKNLAFIEI